MESDNQIFEGRLFLIGSLVMLIFFTGRVIIFLWRFIFTSLLPSEVFYTFGYIAPELIPSFIHIYITRERKRVGSEGRKFIEGLYDATSSDSIASFYLADNSNEDAQFIRDEMPSPIQRISNTKQNSLDITVNDFDGEVEEK